MQIGSSYSPHALNYEAQQNKTSPTPAISPLHRTEQPDAVLGAASPASLDGSPGKVKNGECQTCKNRTYVDGSKEGNVSFKSPGHISPEASASVVSAHESEHVANARQEGNKEGNELISASVRLQMAICPECGRSYVAGGVTTTTIRYGQTPYDNAKKQLDALALRGANVDLAV